MRGELYLVRVQQVFELRISEPRQVTILTRADEYRALKVCAACRITNHPIPHGGLQHSP